MVGVQQLVGLDLEHAAIGQDDQVGMSGMGGGACRDDGEADDESDEGQSAATAWRHQS
jgi:hypothetical protein